MKQQIISKMFLISKSESPGLCLNPIKLNVLKNVPNCFLKIEFIKWSFIHIFLFTIKAIYLITSGMKMYIFIEKIYSLHFINNETSLKLIIFIAHLMQYFALRFKQGSRIYKHFRIIFKCVELNYNWRIYKFLNTKKINKNLCSISARRFYASECLIPHFERGTNETGKWSELYVRTEINH